MFISILRFGEFPAIISSHRLSATLSLFLPSVTAVMYLLFFMMVSLKFLRLSSFFFSLFSFNYSTSVISKFLSLSLLILSSAWSSLLLSLCSIFFHSVIVLFTSRIYVWFFFIISISLLMFFLILCMHHFPDFI